MIDPAPIVTWLTQHAWAPLLGLAVFTIVRMTKPDVKLTPFGIAVSVPPWLRPIVGTAAGIALAGIVGGQPWSLAIDNGLVATILAILAHEGIVERARDGEELPVPAPLRAPPTIPRPPSVPSFPDPTACIACDAPTDPSPPPTA